MSPIHEGRSEFHAELSWWLSEIAEAVPWHPYYRLLQPNFGRGRTLSEYSEGAACVWMREGVTVSGVPCDSESSARALERPVIRSLRPIFNDGRKARHRTDDFATLSGQAVARAVNDREHVRNGWRPWFIDHWRDLQRFGSGVLGAVEVDDRVLPVGVPRRVSGDAVLRPGEHGVPGIDAREARDFLDERKPYDWYSVPCPTPLR